MPRGITVLVICLLALMQAGTQTQTAAQTQAETQTFELLRFDDDHSWLAKAKDKRFYWTIGGDIRQELGSSLRAYTYTLYTKTRKTPFAEQKKTVT